LTKDFYHFNYWNSGSVRRTLAKYGRSETTWKGSNQSTEAR